MKRTIALLILAAPATSALSACVVDPPGGYNDRPQYYHPNYPRY